MMEKEKALEMALSQIEKQFGKGAIMKLGDAAAGCHTVPNRISSRPTLNSAGVPLISMYSVMDATANTAKKPQAVKMPCAAFSTADLLP